MAHPKYLLQERDGQKPYVYRWTPVLAKKEGFRPISDKEAARYLKPQLEKRIEIEADGDRGKAARIRKEQIHTDLIDAEVDEPEDVDELLDDDDIADQSILDELKPGAVKTSSIDGEARPLVVTQADLLKEEIKKINQFKKSTSIEEYLLKKYKMSMLPMNDVDEMKQQAHSVVETLAATNSLY